MNTPVLFADAEALIGEGLRTALATVTVLSVIGETRPAEFVLVSRTGGLQRTVTSDAALLAIEAWSSSKEAAHDLAQLCRAHVQNLRGTVVDGTQLYRVAEVGGLVSLPDPTSGQWRYTFLIEAHIRATKFEP